MNDSDGFVKKDSEFFGKTQKDSERFKRIQEDAQSLQSKPSNNNQLNQIWLLRPNLLFIFDKFELKDEFKTDLKVYMLTAV